MEDEGEDKAVKRQWKRQKRTVTCEGGERVEARRSRGGAGEEQRRYTRDAQEMHKEMHKEIHKEIHQGCLRDVLEG